MQTQKYVLSTASCDLSKEKTNKKRGEEEKESKGEEGRREVREEEMREKKRGEKRREKRRKGEGRGVELDRKKSIKLKDILLCRVLSLLYFFVC